MSGMKTLHFTLGPVQGFVAQARRTRDLYSGSFLLSYLTGQAVGAILKAGGKIAFPKVDVEGKITDPLLKAIMSFEAGEAIKKPPFLGTLPNRFKAYIPGEFNPSDCETAIYKAWEKITGVVWDKFIEDAALADHEKVRSSEIWDRQIKNFWEIAWAVGEGNDLLDRRKNWRSYVPGDEPGDKCTLMGTLQELSGYIRASERMEQDLFWEALRKNMSSKNKETLDLRKDERLCSVSLVKRLFPRIAEQAIGWKVPVNYPSTSYMAAVHWIAATIEKKPEWARDFCSLAARMPSVVKNEYGNSFDCINRASKKQPQAIGIACLDGKCFFENALENDLVWLEGTSDIRKQMGRKLKELKEDKPSPFYAVLLMDGDHLGALLSKYDSASVSRALARFSENVESLVKNHNGITVYAGGDDVMALLPLEDALAAASALRDNYGQAFRAEFKDNHLIQKEATLSGAVIYAQNHVPLKAVVLKAHDLLDKVAKEESGRDSLAVTVWKGAGIALTWSAPWEVIFRGKPNIIDELVELFEIKNKAEGHYNSTFFYNIRNIFSLLSNKDGLLNIDMEPIDLLTAEYIKNRERKVDINDARERIRRLLQICHRSWRENGVLREEKGTLKVDGALLVRFLAGKGGH